VKPPVHTIVVGTAWGEAAMLLAAGAKVRRQIYILESRFII
jgi:ATP-dependent protease ClpP protease subunit